MKRLIRFQLEGETYVVEVERHGDRLIVRRGAESYTVVLLPEPEPVAISVSSTQAAGAMAASAAQSPVEPGRAAATAKGGEAVPPAAGTLHAPMTGVIKEIRVKVGSDVKKGDVVLVMEAMKMDVEVSCPATGVVAEIPVKAGDTVESQQVLIVIQ
jgi:biotin carboxyl carrier protein